MSKLLIEYDDSGIVTGWRYTPEDDADPGESEFEADQSQYDHRDIARGKYRVDMSGEGPILVERTDFEPREQKEQRAEESREQFGEFATDLAERRREYNEARATAQAARSDYQNASDDSERLNALAQYTLAQDDLIDSLAKQTLTNAKLAGALYQITTKEREPESLLD